MLWLKIHSLLRGVAREWLFSLRLHFPASPEATQGHVTAPSLMKGKQECTTLKSESLGKSCLLHVLSSFLLSELVKNGTVLATHQLRAPVRGGQERETHCLLLNLLHFRDLY